MNRLLVLAVACSLLVATIDAQRRRSAAPLAPAFGDPLPKATAAALTAFEAGRAEFIAVNELKDGLGPVFNQSSCVACHLVAAIGGSSGVAVIRFGTVTNGVFDPLERFGGPVLQVQGLGAPHGATHGFSPETPPKVATIQVRRRSSALFGLGLVDATPDATFIALAEEQAARNDGTAGRASSVENLAAGMRTVGKFGWKAQVPTLFQFSGDAYLNELGITSPFFPHENCPGGNCDELQFNPQPGLNDGGEVVQIVADFMSMLAPPPRGPITADVLAGERVFERIGCHSCHVATLQTGPHPNPAFDRVTYHPYSDFLLNDMGSLGDGIEDGPAGAREMRTAPLWGLRVVRQLLHDGRTRSIEEAIREHDGQGRRSRDRFMTLSDADRDRLLAFLRSL